MGPIWVWIFVDEYPGVPALIGGFIVSRRSKTRPHDLCRVARRIEPSRHRIDQSRPACCLNTKLSQ
jgi:hypothetical protein